VALAVTRLVELFADLDPAIAAVNPDSQGPPGLIEAVAIDYRAAILPFPGLLQGG
jgi:hypothetical protein